METFLLVVFAFLLGSAVACFATLWWMRWTLRRKNRVVPTVASPAPVTWLAMPHQPARLHRRLQVAVRVVRVHTGMPDRPGRRARTLAAGSTASASGTLTDMVQQLESEAAGLDHEITVVSRAPRAARRAHMAELDRRVRRLEQLSGRVAQMAVEDAHDALPPGDPGVAALDQLSEQLDVLQQARAEVAAVERKAGLPPPPQPQMTPAPKRPF